MSSKNIFFGLLVFLLCLCACGASSVAENQALQPQTNQQPTNNLTAEANLTLPQNHNPDKEPNRNKENPTNAKPSCLNSISDSGGKLPRVIAEGRKCLREQLPKEVISEIEKSQKRKYVEYSLTVALQPSNPDDDKNPRFERQYTFVGAKDEAGKIYNFQNADEIENGWTFTKKGKTWIYKGRES